MENNIQKFMALDQVKRDRIINASMKEFRYGYKKASTDSIVKEAGISKGLLFHYFGTKEKLYEFVLRYSNNMFQEEYFNMINQGQSDILEGFAQSSLLMRDIVDRHPYIHEFSYGAHAHKDDIPGNLFDEIVQDNEDVFAKMVTRCDLNLFRSDVDAERAVDLIFWAIQGFFEYANVKQFEDYEAFLEELRSYIDILRLCFYK